MVGASPHGQLEVPVPDMRRKPPPVQMGCPSTIRQPSRVLPHKGHSQPMDPAALLQAAVAHASRSWARLGDELVQGLGLHQHQQQWQRQRAVGKIRGLASARSNSDRDDLDGPSCSSSSPWPAATVKQQRRIIRMPLPFASLTAPLGSTVPAGDAGAQQSGPKFTKVTSIGRSSSSAGVGASGSKDDPDDRVLISEVGSQTAAPASAAQFRSAAGCMPRGVHGVWCAGAACGR